MGQKQNGMSRKVLIVKAGYSETLDSKVSALVSLGDVLRTTAILHLFADDEVVWLTDAKGLPLLEGNPRISRIVTFDLLSALALLSERFDIIVNLEKSPGLCAMADRIEAWRRYGFRFDPRSGKALSYQLSDEALYIASSEEYKKAHGKSWLQVLFGMMGREYAGENYILGYQPATTETYDIGFNTEVGPKTPCKAWPRENWTELERLAAGRFSYDYQRSLNDLRGYMDWINSCRVIVTNDSLGLHLALALRKKVVALFGPTISSEIHDMPNLVKLHADPGCCPFMPCLDGPCRNKVHCMQTITPVEVMTTVSDLLEKPGASMSTCG
ncbi:MAG TPA: glycosyltransferase family 9 protein [Candidatus Brocadiia bacterium]|nr:glycosyltransferase family 9 protein [Candidatus Brocadiia bacterium]